MQTPSSQTRLDAAGCAPIRRLPLAGLWRDLVDAWRHAIVRRQVVDLDDITLRDLGISRSELISYHAETDGLADKTRLRVIGRRGAGTA